MLTVLDGRRVGLNQMAGEGRLSEVRVERRDLGWIGNVDGRREGRKTRRNSGVWEEITRWRIVKERKLLKCRVRLVAILRRLCCTGPEALLKVGRRTGASKLGIAGSAILN